MRVEVDQSTKIEQAGPTVLAFANDLTHAVLIPSKVKLVGYRTLVAKGKAREVARLMVFAAGIALLLENYLAQLNRVVIDEAYEGKSGDIKAFLLRYIWRKAPDFDADNIVFRRIGKHPPADQKARKVRLKKDTRYRKITVKDLLRVVA
jgi:hypothetical protein